MTDEIDIRRTTVGVVLVNADGHVLMQLRDDIPTIADPGCWVNPGGVIDPGEAPEDGARREMLEETEYRCGPLVLMHERVLHRPEGWAERQYYYLGQYDGVQPLVCHEGQMLRFLDPATLPDLKTSPDLAGIILGILERAGPAARPAAL
ncbi:MAG: NUDIX domain-containing protein [Chloroflexota bacterium]